jgi:hypothetical protein
MEGIQKELENAGIETVGISQEMIENSRCTEDEFAEMEVDPTIDAVVSGYYPNWTFKLL